MADDGLPGLYPENALTVLDAGRDFGGGAPAEIHIGDRTAPNPRRDSPPDSLLGSRQKAWFLDRLKASPAPWKIWGHSQGNLLERLDVENLPADMKNPWPGVRYAASGDAIHELREICEAVRNAGVTGFATVSGNRHSFWAGYSAPALPPAEPFQPVGVNFITGAISSSSAGEYYAWLKPADRPLGQLMVTDRPGGVQEPTLNLLYRLGFKAAAEYAKSGDLARARALANQDLAPHLRFLDLGGNGYAVVTAAADALDCEFVCIPTPREPAGTPDGGPVRYRVVHRTPLWKAGERPVLEQRVIEGDPKLSV
jgi:alkaline phosphatase D